MQDQHMVTKPASIGTLLAHAVMVKEPRPIGPDEDPEARLLGQVSIGGVSFHVELHAVQEVPCQCGQPCGGTEQVGVLPNEESGYADLADAIGGTGPFMTLTLNGREYVLIVFPYCR